jgi:SAM-dependent methyltransferase
VTLRKVLGIFFIVIGIIDLCLDFVAFWNDPSKVLSGPLALMVGVSIIAIGYVVLDDRNEEKVTRWVTLVVLAWRGQPPAVVEPTPPKQIEEEVKKHAYVVGATAPPPPRDEWNLSLRQVLHQANLYSTPTYYLDRNLNIVDWNIAFEALFAEIIGNLRMTHVNWFISKLAEPERVYKHAKVFSEQNPLPLIDSETLQYDSLKYGRVRMVKIAAQLHDDGGTQRGWTVSLLIRSIGNWSKFREEIQVAFKNDKLWSYYGPSYDRVLLQYPPYSQLQQIVTEFVPRGSLLVADIGAGTGNTTQALLKRGHSVWAVENNMMMLDNLRKKNFDPARVKIINSSAEHLDTLAEQSRRQPFDAAVLVNVLYALNDPLACLKSLNRLMVNGGVLAFSTTHSGTRLQPLLDDIKRELLKSGSFDRLADDFQCVEVGNQIIEPIARRHTREQYLSWVKAAGFDLLNHVPIAYPNQEIGAVMIVHARKARDPEETPTTPPADGTSGGGDVGNGIEL